MIVENNVVLEITNDDLKNNSLIIPNGVKEIKTNALNNVDKQNIKDVYLPNTLRVIEDYVFDNCTNLSNVRFYNNDINDSSENNKINNNLQKLGIRSFAFTNLDKFFLPKTLDELGRNCFYGSNLSDLEFDKECSLKVFNSSVINECENLSTLIIPEGVKEFDSFDLKLLKNLKQIIFEGDIKISRFNNLGEADIQTKAVFKNKFGTQNLNEIISLDEKFGKKSLVLYKDKEYKILLEINSNIYEYKINYERFLELNTKIVNLLSNGNVLKLYEFENVLNKLDIKNKIIVDVVNIFDSVKDIEKFLSSYKTNKIYRNIERKLVALHSISNTKYIGNYFTGLLSLSSMLGAFSEDKKLSQKAADFVLQEVLKSKNIYSLSGLTEFDGVKLYFNENESYYQFIKENFSKLMNLNEERYKWKPSEKVEFVNYLNKNYDRLKQICKQNKQTESLELFITIYENEKMSCDDARKKDIYDELIKYPYKSQKNVDYIFSIKQEMEKNKISQNAFEKVDVSQIGLLYDESKLEDKLAGVLDSGYAFVWLNKYRTKNLTYAVDDRTGCANIFSRGVGVVTCGMKLSNCQNLRIIAPDGTGIGRATVTVDENSGNLLYNTFMVYGHTRMSKNEKMDILNCFKDATIAFILEYEKNFKGKKIKQVNVGINSNGLRDVLLLSGNKQAEIMNGINFNLYTNFEDSKYLWTGDWQEGQICLFNSVQLRQAKTRFKNKYSLQEDVNKM